MWIDNEDARRISLALGIRTLPLFKNISDAATDFLFVRIPQKVSTAIDAALTIEHPSHIRHDGYGLVYEACTSPCASFS